MPADQQEFVYEGGPASRTGDFTTLIIPMGAIMRDVAEQVFGSCFVQGVTFAEQRVPGGDYVVAIEGDLQKFLYSYTEVIDQGFFEDDPDTWIVPQVEMAFDVRVYDVNGAKLLERIYNSGTISGEDYLVASRPHERINQTLHATVHGLILQVAEDIRPLLVGKCAVTGLS